jgi:hypothetical protein
MRQICGTPGEFRYSGSKNVAPSDRNLPVLLTVVKYCQLDDTSMRWAYVKLSSLFGQQITAFTECHEFREAPFINRGLGHRRRS